MNTFRDFIPEGEEVPASNVGAFRDFIPDEPVPEPEPKPEPKPGTLEATVENMKKADFKAVVGDESKTYPCDFCGKVCQSFIGLQGHIRGCKTAKASMGLKEKADEQVTTQE